MIYSTLSQTSYLTHSHCHYFLPSRSCCYCKVPHALVSHTISCNITIIPSPSKMSVADTKHSKIILTPTQDNQGNYCAAQYFVESVIALYRAPESGCCHFLNQDFGTRTSFGQYLVSCPDKMKSHLKLVFHLLL